MNKSKEKHFNFLSRRQNRYAIRRFSAGIASVLVGTALFFGAHTSEASAAEQGQTSEAKQRPLDSSDTTDTLTETNEKVAQAPTTETNPSVEEMNHKEATGNGQSIASPQTAEQSNETKTIELPINDTENTTEAPVKEATKDVQTTDESNRATPKNDTKSQSNHEKFNRESNSTEEATIEETKLKTSSKEAVTEEHATEEMPQEDTSHSEELRKDEKDTTEKQTTESSSSEKSATENPTYQLESPSTAKPTNQTQMNTKYPQMTEQELLALLETTDFDHMDLATKTLYLGHLKEYADKQDALTPAATVKSRNQSEKLTTAKTKAVPNDVVPENEMEIPADAIKNGYIKSGTDATNAAHTLSGRAWVLGHGTPATMANGLKPVPEGTKVHLQWIDKDGATSPIYTAQTTNRLSSVDGSQVGPGAYAFDLRQGWTDANGKHHVYSATKGQRYQLWIDDFKTKDGQVATMLRVAGGYLPGTYVDSVTDNNMGQFPLIGTNMQRTGIFMTTTSAENDLTAKHHIKDPKGAAANPAVTMIEDNFISGKVWIETSDGDKANSATGPNFNSKDKAAAGYKVVMTSLTDHGAKAYDAHVNHLPEHERAAAARKLLLAHPEYMSVTVEGTTNARGEYTLRFPKGTLDKNHLYGYVVSPDGHIVKGYSGFNSSEFRRPNYDLSLAPQTAPYYRPIRHAWVNVNFAVVETTHAQINIKNFDVTSNPAHRGQTAYVDITGMPHTSLPVRVQWKDASGQVVQNSGPVTTEAEAEGKGKLMIPTDAKSGEVYTVELMVGDHVTATDSLVVHVNEDAAKYHPIYPPTTVEPGQQVTIPAPKNKNGRRLPNGTTFEKGHHVPQWVTVNRDGSITVKPGDKVAEGDYDIPVIVTYSDGSKNTIFAPVTVQAKEPMATQYEPTSNGVKKKYGESTTADDVLDTVEVPDFPMTGEQPVATVDDETQLPDGTVEGQVGVDVSVTYPDGTTDHITVQVVTEKQPDSDKYDPVATGILKRFGDPTTEEDVTKLVEVPGYPTDLPQPKVTVTDSSTLPDGQTPGKVDVDVTVTYLDGTTDHISVPVWTNKQLDKDKYDPTTGGVTKPFGTPVTSTDITDSIQIPNYPVEGEQPTVTVDDETQIPDGTVEGQVGVDVTVTYPDGTTDHITVPVVTEKQPDNEKYEPTTPGVTKPFGTPTTAAEVTGSVTIPNFPVDGKQPVVTVNDPRQLPNGKKEGQINVPVTVTYPDGTTDLMTVPVVTGKQAENEKYDPITLGVYKDYGHPTTAADVTDSIQIPTYPVGSQQPVATVDDKTQLPNGTTEGEVDIPVTVTYPDGTQDHITVPVFTSKQRDNQKYEPTSEGVTKDYGIPTGVDDVLDTITVPNYPADREEQPVKTVDAPDRLPDGTTEGKVLVGVTVTYPDGSKDHIKVPVVTNPPKDNVRYEPTTEGITKQFGEPTTAADVTGAVKVPNFPTDGEQPVVTVIDPRQLPNGKKAGQTNVGVTVTYPDGTTDYFTVPVVTNPQTDSDKYTPTTEGITKQFGEPTTASEVEEAVEIPGYPVDVEPPVVIVKDPTQLPDGKVGATVDVDVMVMYPDGSMDEISVPVSTSSPDDEGSGHGSSGSSSGGSVSSSNGPTVRPSIQLPSSKSFATHFVGPSITAATENNQQSESDKYTPTSESVTKDHGIPVTTTDVTDAGDIPNYPTDAEQPTVTVIDETQLPDDMPTVAKDRETVTSATKDQQPVRDKVVTIPTVAQSSKQANYDGENDTHASNQTDDMIEKVTPVTTTAASVANGNVSLTRLATASLAQVTQPVRTSAETTTKEAVKRLPETGESTKQASALLGGLIAVIGGLLLFGRRRNEKQD